MEKQELIPHLFRTEYRKIVTVLCKFFGFEQIVIAEDIASDTFLVAAQTWPLEGIPPNPVAWLYSVAKNKAKNHLHRNTIYQHKVIPVIKKGAEETDDTNIDLNPQNINDSQLQMMFALCHPSIPPEAQVGLSLRILCGFGIDEIADAFLTNKETINKRLCRAKEKLREENIKIELPSANDIDERLVHVLTTLYLLFSEGYHSSSSNQTLRKDFCFEAMRLCQMLIENKATKKPPVNALMALMFFHASRFKAREKANGEMILYDEQDTTFWDTDMINKGIYFLNCAATGNALSKYHLEAAIAYWTTQKDDTKEKWENILQLHNRLLQIEYSPIAALNRTYALAKANGKEQAIKEAEKINMANSHFYFALLGELYTDMDNNKATRHFETALSLAKTPADKQAMQRKIDRLRKHVASS